MRSGKFVRYLGWTILVLGFGGMITWKLLGDMWQRDVDRQLAALKADGWPTTAADLRAPTIPPDQNAADIYRPFENPAMAMRDMGAMGSTSSADVNQLQDCWMDILHQFTPKMPVEVARILAKPEFADALAAYRRGSSRPHCLFGDEFGPSRKAPRSQFFSGAMRLVVIRARAAAGGGRMDEALAWYEVGLRMAAQCADEPSSLGFVGSLANRGRVMRELRNDLSLARPVSPEAVERIARYLRDVDIQSALTPTLAAERAYMIDALVTGVERPGWSAAPRGWDLGSIGDRLRASGLGRPVRLRELGRYLTRAEQCIEVSQVPTSQSVHVVEGVFGPFAPVPRTALQANVARLRRTVAYCNLERARLAVAIVALEVVAYRTGRGKYPVSLETLQADVKERLPKDPYTDKPLIYRRKGAGFIVYSIGEDLRDNGGDAQKDVIWESAR